MIKLNGVELPGNTLKLYLKSLGSTAKFSWWPLLFNAFSSVQFSQSVVSDSLWPHGLQHTSPPSLSSTPGVYLNSCPSSRRCHPTILSSVIAFSSHLQSFPASGCFEMSQFFALGGQSIGVLASTSVIPMNIQHWFPLGWTGQISLLSISIINLLTILVYWRKMQSFYISSLFLSLCWLPPFLFPTEFKAFSKSI